MRKVGNLRILTSRLVDDRLTGDYHSVFKGHGMEFDEVRAYVPGDDVRSIDWNVTARTGYPHVKRYSEERELTVVFLVDVSGSQAYGSGKRPKSELAAELTCLLALTSVRNQDKIGLMLFSDRVVKYLPPRKGRTAVMRLVREVLASDEATGGTDIAAALHFLNGVQRRKAVVFIISDFQDNDFEKPLRVTARRHDVVCCHLSDPAEHRLPDVGLVELQDPESGETLWVDTSAAAVRAAFADQSKEVHGRLLQLFRRNRLDPMFLTTDVEPIDEVRRLFHRRATRARRPL
jgi:uncharacterized protein (DUF58 family)